MSGNLAKVGEKFREKAHGQGKVREFVWSGKFEICGSDKITYLYFIRTVIHFLQSINQSIKTHFYSAICRERIRGACVMIAENLDL